MDYEAPQEHNPKFASVSHWAVKYTCRCGQRSSVSSEARYVRQTCRTCGTVWEVAPSLSDSTPYTVKKAAIQHESQPEGMNELIQTVQGIAEKLDFVQWQLEHHRHHIHSEQGGTLEATLPELNTYYSDSKTA